MAKGKVLMMTEEQEKDFNLLSERIRFNHDNRERYVGELLVVLGILQPYEAAIRLEELEYQHDLEG